MNFFNSSEAISMFWSITVTEGATLKYFRQNNFWTACRTLDYCERSWKLKRKELHTAISIKYWLAKSELSRSKSVTWTLISLIAGLLLTLPAMTIDHFWITLEFPRTITWSRGFVSSFYTFAVFSRTKPQLQVIVPGNWSVTWKWSIYLLLCFTDSVSFVYSSVDGMQLKHRAPIILFGMCDCLCKCQDFSNLYILNNYGICDQCQLWPSFDRLDKSGKVSSLNFHPTLQLFYLG